MNTLMPVRLPSGRLRLATRPCLDRVDRRSRTRPGSLWSRQPGGKRRHGAAGAQRCTSRRAANQLGGKRRQASVLSVGPAIFDRDVLAVNIARFLEPLAKGRDAAAPRMPTDGCHEDSRCTGIAACCARADKRPIAAAPPSTAMNSRRLIRSPRRRGRVGIGGTSRPSALAVLRLITNSYLVGACTGRSAGFSPLRMRST